MCLFSTHVLGLQRYEAFLNKQVILKLIFVYFFSKCRVIVYWEVKHSSLF